MIVIDIGNTDTVIGFFKEEKCINTLRVRSLKNESPVFFEYRILDFMLENNLAKEDFKHAVISSVVPILTPYFVRFCEKFLNLNPFVVNPAHSGFLKINIDMPEELGSDLFVNALSALETFKTDCIIVDFGTALTFTVVKSEGIIEGVTILPGIKTALKSLFSDTSLLPEVKLEKPECVIGKNSMHAIRAGVLYGYEGMIVKLLERIKAEIGRPVKVLATGGLSAVLTDLAPNFDKIDIDLTIKGLYLYGQKSIYKIS
ncbi:MAG: type III pantothenate kinase [Cytophagaceae bacterium]|nr:type III pantothenate kinase [Cytophagaceae bacterium]MBL0303045.1 type III pantothenate kinase [Cytophagaceae bacterium]MBL0325889.1 type III pantothenate kinase [Cytophagaceae bacterium]